MDQTTDCEISPIKSNLGFTSPSFEGPSLNLDHNCASPTSEFDADFSLGCDECYDAVLLCSELDMETAETIVNQINEIELEEGIKAKVELYELVYIKDIEKFARLKKVLQMCSYVFVLCTSNFNNDLMTRYLADECVMNSIMNKDKKQPWQVVPIINPADHVDNLPMGLNSLQPIKLGTRYAFKKISMMLKNGSKRNLVRSQSIASMSKISIQESSISAGNKESSDLSSGYLSLENTISMVTSSFPSTKDSLQENQSTDECQDSMATSSFQSSNNSLQENQSTDECRNSMATSSFQSTKDSLQENQSTVECRNSMADTSFQSPMNSLQENQSTDECRNSTATSSFPSPMNSLQENQSTDECRNSMATSSFESPKNSLQENQSTDECRNSMATSSFESPKDSLQENQSTDECRNSMATSSFESPKDSLQENQSTDECKNSMAASSLQSTKNSLQENQSTDECRNSMAASSFVSRNNSLQENLSTDECQDSMAALSIKSANNSLHECKANTKKNSCKLS